MDSFGVAAVGDALFAVGGGAGHGGNPAADVFRCVGAGCRLSRAQTAAAKAARDAVAAAAKARAKERRKHMREVEAGKRRARKRLADQKAAALKAHGVGG